MYIMSNDRLTFRLRCQLNLKFIIILFVSVASWFISPVLSGTISVLLFLIIKRFIIQSSNPLKYSLRSLPFFYGGTIAINVFSIIHDGPERKQSPS